MKLKSNIAISDNGFVFDANSGASFSVNPVGLEILNKLKQSMEKEEIRQKILAHYEVDEYTLEHNLVDFFGLLQKYDIIED